MLKKIAATFLLSCLFILKANAAGLIEETMFSSGKINTFLVVAFVVLGGIFFYLFRMDSKLTKLEKESKGKDQ